MTDPALIERITRSLAYMLRHQPHEFDLELDAHGYGDVDEVVRALNERLGEPVERTDLEAAIVAGDRPRYEIVGERVRALYGHSIPVEPGEPAQPPELLYVGLGARDAERAIQHGLSGGRRRFLHLARSVDDARESGRRAGREYAVLVVRATEAWEEGVNFYDRQALFLSEAIPTRFIGLHARYQDGEDRPIGERGGWAPRHADAPRRESVGDAPRQARPDFDRPAERGGDRGGDRSGDRGSDRGDGRGRRRGRGRGRGGDRDREPRPVHAGGEAFRDDRRPAERDDSRRPEMRRDEPRRDAPRRDESVREPEPRREAIRRDAEPLRDEPRRDAEPRRDEFRRDAEPRRDFEPRRDDFRRESEPRREPRGERHDSRRDERRFERPDDRGPARSDVRRDGGRDDRSHGRSDRGPERRPEGRSDRDRGPESRPFERRPDERSSRSERPRPQESARPDPVARPQRPMPASAPSDDGSFGLGIVAEPERPKKVAPPPREARRPAPPPQAPAPKPQEDAFGGFGAGV